MERAGEADDVGALRVRAREADGGLPGLKALPMSLGARGQAQVSMNLVDLERTTVADAFDAVQRQRLTYALAGAAAVAALALLLAAMPALAQGPAAPADLPALGDLIFQARAAVALLRTGDYEIGRAHV